MAKKKAKAEDCCIPISDPDFWTLEFTEFLVRVGVNLSVARGEGASPMTLPLGKPEPISEEDALELLRSKKMKNGMAIPPDAGPQTPTNWTLSASWVDSEAKVWRVAELTLRTTGAWRIVEEFRRYQATGELSEEALSDRRKAKQEALDHALHDAVADRDLAAVKATLAQGASPNIIHSGMPLVAFLCTTCEDEFVPIIRAMVEAGAPLEGFQWYDSSTAPLLWTAAREGFVSAVELLLELGADPNCVHDGQGIDDFHLEENYIDEVAAEIRRLVGKARADKAADAIGSVTPVPKHKVKKQRPGL